MAGRVSFLGAGPGAADLITVRGARRLAEADVVLWASTAVDPACVREHARPDTELVDSSRIDAERLWEIYRRAARERLRVVRVCSGDAVVWGSIQEQFDGCRRLGLDVEIVPGVAEFTAAAASIGCELTTPTVGQSLVLSAWEGGATQAADGERIREFARYGTTMVVSMPAARVRQLIEQLRVGGYPEQTPVVVAYKVSCPDELVLRTTLGELADTVRRHKLWRNAFFLVGDALRPGGSASRYSGSVGYRPSGRESGDRGESEPVDAPGVLPAPRLRPGAEWALQVRRSSWLAPRPSGHDSPEQPPDTPAPVSAAAWSAVRQWQETARSAGRIGTRNRSVGDIPRSIASPRRDQPTLDLEAAPGSIVAAVTSPATTATAKTTTAKTTTAKTATAVPRQDPAEAAAKPAAKKAPVRRKRPAKPAQRSDSPTAARRDSGGATAAPPE